MVVDYYLIQAFSELFFIKVFYCLHGWLLSDPADNVILFSFYFGLKGSTCAFTESILRSYGFRTGLFTSPHLIDVRERFRLDG